MISPPALGCSVFTDSNAEPNVPLQEYQSCNTLPCPDLKKTTPWTPWTPVNISDNGGHYEQRFRYTCKARIPDPGLLEVGRQRIEMRYCSSDGSTGCSTDGECGAEKTDGLCSSYLSLWMLLRYRTPSASLQVTYGPPRVRPLLLPVVCPIFLPIKLFSVCVQQEFQGINQPLVLVVPRSSALSADQRTGRVNVLPIHKADQQLTAYFSAPTLKHALNARSLSPSTPPVQAAVSNSRPCLG